MQRDLIGADKVGDLSSYADFVTFVPLYATPQPAEPVVKDSLTTDEAVSAAQPKVSDSKQILTDT